MRIHWNFRSRSCRLSCGFRTTVFYLRFLYTWYLLYISNRARVDKTISKEIVTINKPNPEGFEAGEKHQTGLKDRKSISMRSLYFRHPKTWQ